MPTPFWTRLVLALAAGLWLALAFLLDAPVDAEWLQPLGAVMAAVVLLLLAFDRLAWRWLPLAVTKRPMLHGTWKSTLEFEWPGGTPPQSKECYLVVRQTYSTVTVDMLFDISSSQSRSAAIREVNGRRGLWWSYWSAARTLDREDNPPHRGGAELVISVKPVLRLEGDYWTERKTRGRILTHGRSKHIYDDFESARGGSYQ